MEGLEYLRNAVYITYIIIALFFVVFMFIAIYLADIRDELKGINKEIKRRKKDEPNN